MKVDIKDGDNMNSRTEDEFTIDDRIFLIRKVDVSIFNVKLHVD